MVAYISEYSETIEFHTLNGWTVGHNDCCHVGGEIHSLVAKESTRKDASGGKHIGKVRGAGS